MNHRTLAELAALLGTSSLEDPGTVITGVTTDTRSVSSGDLFVAVVGETFDGNDFLVAAMDAGAAGVITSRPDVAGIPRILVADTLVALR
ncbi:MAG: Mur ligase domain-containing protein, partial [Actinomycetota bacterium]|nr:Mur ligase domain-containing protein [Actinomycetota bacterium]